MEAGQRDELEPVAELAERLLERGDLGVVEVPAPVERRRAVVGEQLAREALVDRLRELARLAEVGRRRLEPEQVGVRRVGERRGRSRSRARSGRGRSPPASARPSTNAASASSTSLVSSVADSASVRATRTVGTSQTSAASRAAASVRTNWLVGTSTLPPRWPHFFSEASWSSKCTPAAPASIIAFISSNAFSGPPKPASASATIGASQCVPFRPSAASIWSARRSALFSRRTRAGPELAA